MLADFIEKSLIPEGIMHIAGPPNSGKTTLLYQSCRSLKRGKKALILDCETNFSAKRLQEIVINSKVKLNDVTIISLLNKAQQVKVLMKSHNFLHNSDFAFIGINGITDHFRFGKINVSEREFHNLLNLQIAYLQMISKEYSVPILITNQVTAFKELNSDRFKPVAATVIRNYSDNEISLTHVNRKLWKAKLYKEEVYYSINQNGIEVIKNSF